MPSEERREPATRDEALASLRQAIAQLETAIAQLEAQAAEDFTLRADCAAVTASVERLSGAIAQAGSPEPAATVEPSQPEREPTEPAEPASALMRLANLWAALVAGLRRLLPATLSERLADGVLSGVLVLAIALVALTAVNLLPSREPAPEVAKSPPAATAPAPQRTPPTPSPATPSPEPTPTPKLRLTPEQRLIAAIQDQVAEITNHYADGLIRSIRADFVGDQLIVTVTEAWYGLPAERQDRLASEMLQRSRQLDFSKLELEDPSGELLARSPVVGNSMVIFKRA